MAAQPDMSFDIDALFVHMIDHLSHTPDTVLDWNFSFRSNDLAALEAAADELQGEFDMQLQEQVEEFDAAGNCSLGGPLLRAVRRGALSVEEVKSIVRQMEQVAGQQGLVYEGVSCFTPIDFDETFGWLAPEAAFWRLRHMTDTGLAEDAALPWTFLLITPDLDGVRKLADELADLGYDDCDEFLEPGEGEDFGVCVFIAGRNNEFELNEAASMISQVAERNGGRLEGIQFYTREEADAVFMDEGDDGRTHV